MPSYEKISPQPGRIKSEKRSIFERAYKSKLARTLALFGLLGAGSEFLRKSGDFGHKPTYTQELVRGEKFDIKELGPEFDVEMEVPSDNASIIHIGQVHGGTSLEDTKTMIETRNKRTGESMGVEDIVASQKKIEKLLTLLAEKYKSKAVYAEAVAQDEIDLINAVKDLIRQYEEGDRSQIRTLAELYDKVVSKETGVNHLHQAHLIYLIRNQMVSDRNSLRDNLEKYKAGEEVDRKFSKLFSQNGSQGIAEIILADSQRDINKISSNELISGDNVYLWGAAMKLYLEGKIDLKPAETIETNQAALSSPNISLEERLRLREKTAMQQISKGSDLTKHNFIPLIFGKGHDFKNSVEGFNKYGVMNKVGLIRVMPR